MLINNNKNYYIMLYSIYKWYIAIVVRYIAYYISSYIGT